MAAVADMAAAVTEGVVTLAAEDILAVAGISVVDFVVPALGEVVSAGDRWDLLAAGSVAADSAAPDLAACEAALAARQPHCEAHMPADLVGMAAMVDMDGVAAGSDMVADLVTAAVSMAMDIPASDTDWASGSGRRCCTEVSADMAGTVMGVTERVVTADTEWVAMAAMDSPVMVDTEVTAGMVDTAEVAAPVCAVGTAMVLVIESR
jgi:hypothetical protein